MQKLIKEIILKVKIISKWIIIFSIFFSNISYSNEKFSDVCTFYISTLEKDKKKCIYKCNIKLRFLLINKKTNCYSDLKIINKKKNSKVFVKPKFNFGFSTLDGVSIGIGLE